MSLIAEPPSVRMPSWSSCPLRNFANVDWSELGRPLQRIGFLIQPKRLEHSVSEQFPMTSMSLGVSRGSVSSRLGCEESLNSSFQPCLLLRNG